MTGPRVVISRHRLVVPYLRRRPGFSLIELVLVTIIIGTLAAVAVPRFSNAFVRQQADATARRVVADFTLAQQHAKATSVNQAVRFTASDSYVLIGMTHPDHSGLEYEVHVDEDPYRAVIVSVDFGGDQEIIFDIYGVPDSGGSAVIQVGHQLRTISVDPDTGEASIP